MLQPSHLAPGRGISDAVNSVLQQYSGLETDADDMLVRLAAPAATTLLNFPPRLHSMIT